MQDYAAPGNGGRRSGGARAASRDLTTATLERVLCHATTINIRDNFYRLKDKLKAGLIRADEPAVN